MFYLLQKNLALYLQRPSPSFNADEADNLPSLALVKLRFKCLFFGVKFSTRITIDNLKNIFEQLA